MRKDPPPVICPLRPEAPPDLYCSCRAFLTSPPIVSSKTQSPTETPWYENGLRFSCTQCGRCCRGDPGYVWITKAECARISIFLNITPSTFLNRYCRQILSRISLIEYSNGDCVFYSEAGCKIYPVRPAQCQQFPFWSHVMENPREWQRLAEKCPGIGSGKLYKAKEIEAIMSGKRET